MEGLRVIGAINDAKSLFLRAMFVNYLNANYFCREIVEA